MVGREGFTAPLCSRHKLRTPDYKKPSLLCRPVFSWWAGRDSNPRRRSQRIYSPPQLTALVSAHVACLGPVVHDPASQACSLSAPAAPFPHKILLNSSVSCSPVAHSKLKVSARILRGPPLKGPLELQVISNSYKNLMDWSGKSTFFVNHR